MLSTILLIVLILMLLARRLFGRTAAVGVTIPPVDLALSY